MKSTIEKILNDHLKTQKIEVINKSHLHAGHLENDDSGETHFEVRIESEELKKEGRIKAHRRINELLKDQFSQGLHALEIKIK
jgi:BolA protein